MGEKKTIILTKNEFRSKTMKTLAEVISDITKGDIEDVMVMSAVAATFIVKIGNALFKEEEKDGDRN